MYLIDQEGKMNSPEYMTNTLTTEIYAGSDIYVLDFGSYFIFMHAAPQVIKSRDLRLS